VQVAWSAHERAAPHLFGSAAAATSHRVTMRAPLFVGPGQARLDAPPAAGRAWVHRLPCSDTWSVTPVYASFAQLTSPDSKNRTVGEVHRTQNGSALSAPQPVREQVSGVIIGAPEIYEFDHGL